MRWIFSRGSEQLRIENRYDTRTAEFLLVIEHHDGYCETKRFAEALAYRTWLSTFVQRLEAQRWRKAVLRSSDDPISQSRDGCETEQAVRGRDVTSMTTRCYTSGTRAFDVLLSERVLNGVSFWTVERVMDINRYGRFVVIPGMQAVTASTPDVTFARACDCIDRWLWGDRSAR